MMEGVEQLVVNSLWEKVILYAGVPVFAFPVFLVLFRKESSWFDKDVKFWLLVLVGCLFYLVSYNFERVISSDPPTLTFMNRICLYSCFAYMFGAGLAAIRIDYKPKIAAVLLLAISGLGLIVFFLEVTEDFFR